MEILLAFDTTTRAIAAENALLEAQIAVNVMPIPSAIKAGCGICLRLAPQNFEDGKNLLTAKNLFADACYTRTAQNGTSTYAPYGQTEEKHD